ncbi:AbrB family transcriptional regulator [Candidatus Bathyarchaeota archaeon]|nr:AbrB family transcriptional regulator [Candidatus Bathyarchaeota archaeon]
MRMTEIVRVDSRGRITMPSSIREAVRLSEGMYVMLIADLDKKEIRIAPFADPEAKLVELTISFSDVPGALAKAANILAEEGVDLLSSESRTLRRGKSAEWIVIADISRCKCPLTELEKKIVAESSAEEVKFSSYS